MGELTDTTHLSSQPHQTFLPSHAKTAFLTSTTVKEISTSTSDDGSSSSTSSPPPELNSEHTLSAQESKPTPALTLTQPTSDGTANESSILYTKVSNAPPKIVRAKGNYLYTESGQAIFDATCGAAVACIGHNDPRVKEAINRQLDNVAYCYAPFFTTDAAELLAQELTRSTGGEMSRVFVVSSGTEAVEAGLKMARQYFLELPEPQPQRTKFIARYTSYHGNTLGALSVGYHAARRANYEPIVAKNVLHVSPCYPYRDMKDDETQEEYVSRLANELEAKSREAMRIGEFLFRLVETLGCVPPLPGYLKAMKEVCDRHGALFMLDEVMSGMGRTDTLHAWESESVVPDLQTVAKGLGAGYLPIGALLMNRRVVDVLTRGTGTFVHSQTYQGHPVACAAAFEDQRIIREENLLGNVRTLGRKLETRLRERLGDHKNVGDIRGRGFFWGIEIVKDKDKKEPFPVSERISGKIHATGLQTEFGISLMPGAGQADGKNGDVVVLAPAYNINEEDLEFIVERTAAVIERALGR